MSKYVKEMMMDQLRTDLDGASSVLILDLKGLDANAEHDLRRDLRKKSIRIRALKNSLARRVFGGMGMEGLAPYLEGPSVAVWGGVDVAELAKEVSAQVKNLKTPEVKGAVVEGVVVGPDQVEDLTKLPSREALIGQVLSLLAGPAREVLSLLSSPSSTLVGQLEAHIEKQGGAAPEAAADAAPEAGTDAAPEAEAEAGPSADADAGPAAG